MASKYPWTPVWARLKDDGNDDGSLMVSGSSLFRDEVAPGCMTLENSSVEFETLLSVMFSVMASAAVAAHNTPNKKMKKYAIFYLSTQGSLLGKLNEKNTE